MAILAWLVFIGLLVLVVVGANVSRSRARKAARVAALKAAHPNHPVFARR